MPNRKTLTDYLPGILLFSLALIIGLATYNVYGVSWDEPLQRDEGLISYNYVAYGQQDLFTQPNDNHGTGFELLLILVEKKLNLNDSRDIYMMRHIVSHLVFLIAAFCLYVLVFRLFRNKYLACLGFIMLLLAPRIYAHSFINSKDVPFLSMFVISFMLCEMAFEKNKPWLFLLLGMACGYATSIRIMGLMILLAIAGFIVIDLIADIIKKNRPVRRASSLLLFMSGAFAMLYIGWPYIQKDPLRYIVESYFALSHFNKWGGAVFIHGQFYLWNVIPWHYFPLWFLISTPIVWLIIGFTGIMTALIALVRNPLRFFTNTKERQFLLYGICFVVPIAAVILLHSVIYDDWRHLYFVYPSFILLGMYAINEIKQAGVKQLFYGAAIIQSSYIGWFMISSFPFPQVYFNHLVSHKEEYLRKNYDFEYWGCSFRQALEYLLAHAPAGKIKVCKIVGPLNFNLLILTEKDRNRIEVVDASEADYLITDFRLHPEDYGCPVYYSIKVLNSTVMCIYKLR